jgi:phosphoglucosamine mutase
MAGKYFGTDGIRGRANSPKMSPALAMRVGMAAGLAFKRENSERMRVVIGKDTRLSGYMIENALLAGFTSAGVDVFQLGPIPTPAVAMLTRSLRADMGVMISASHNQFDDNGIKLFGPDGYKLSDDIEQDIENLIDTVDTKPMPTGKMLGRAKRIDGVVDRYIEFAKRTLPRNMSFEGLRVVVDCANGAAYKTAPAALWELGADVVTIGADPNGTNINLDCGSTHPMALARKVHEVRADIGIALDGDADRVIIVDETGAVIDGDQIMALIARTWHENGRLEGNGVVATIMSNLGLERFINAMNLQLHRTKVGDRYVVEHMRKFGLNVGGEQSGHVVLSDYGTTGDGLVSALQVVSCMKQLDRPVSEICRLFEPVPQMLKNVRLNGGQPLTQQKVKVAIADAEQRLGSANGRLVIRPSGTEPLIRVMAEGDDQDLVENVVNDLVDVISQFRDAA